VGAHLEQADFIHAMPGQALATFRRARNLGVKTVLNHATGPVCEWVRIMEPEYRRAGLRLEDATMYDAAYFRRETEEYALADFHCSASTVVRDQLIATGIAPEKIWLVPYGADARIFHPLEFAADSSEKFRIVFAGQVGLRKGLGTLLQAFQLARREGWTLDFFGTVLPEARDVLERFGSDEAWNFHGPVSQSALAAAFQKASIVVLPSLEEGFGLVVPQALACGTPCVVSDCTGARDLIRHRENGSVFPVQNSIALADELVWWAEHPARVREDFPWRGAAEKLLRFSSTAT
jgi:glycosyltransferase involved in cell wall biosynthesis